MHRGRRLRTGTITPHGMAYKKKYVITTHTYFQYKEGFGFKIKGKIIVSKKNKRNVKFFLKKKENSSKWRL